MGKRQERRADRASADDVQEVERQLWAFAKRPDPPEVPEAKLRPGAFLYRVHRAWHSLGRGTGIASHSFRALREELLKRDPPVRNLQPKLYGTTSLSLSDAGHLIDVMLETWHVGRSAGHEWAVTPLPHPSEGAGKPADERERDEIRESLLHTLFKGDDHLLLEEPVGVPPETFFEDCGRQYSGLIFATPPGTVVHLSPTNAYAGFSELVGRYFHASRARSCKPLLIWIYRISGIGDSAEFHNAYHALAVHSAAITNWYFRLSRLHGNQRSEAENLWQTVLSHCIFAIHGLPEQALAGLELQSVNAKANELDDDLVEIDPAFFLPFSLPVKFENHPRVRKHPEYRYGMAATIAQKDSIKVDYWLFPEKTNNDPEDTAETTGLPVFNTDMSPGTFYDKAYEAIFLSSKIVLNIEPSIDGIICLNSLKKSGWSILKINEIQSLLKIKEKLGFFSRKISR